MKNTEQTRYIEELIIEELDRLVRGRDALGTLHVCDWSFSRRKIARRVEDRIIRDEVIKPRTQGVISKRISLLAKKSDMILRVGSDDSHQYTNWRAQTLKRIYWENMAAKEWRNKDNVFVAIQKLIASIEFWKSKDENRKFLTLSRLAGQLANICEENGIEHDVTYPDGTSLL